MAQKLQISDVLVHKYKKLYLKKQCTLRTKNFKKLFYIFLQILAKKGLGSLLCGANFKAQSVSCEANFFKINLSFGSLRQHRLHFLRVIKFLLFSFEVFKQRNICIFLLGNIRASTEY